MDKRKRTNKPTTKASPPPPPSIKGPLLPPYRPVELSGVEIAFPGDVLRLRLMPAYEPAYKCSPSEQRWARVADNWFFGREVGEATFEPREGIVFGRAMRHLTAIKDSYQPQHEHKMQALARLMDAWFVWTSEEKDETE